MRELRRPGNGQAGGHVRASAWRITPALVQGWRGGGDFLYGVHAGFRGWTKNKPVRRSVITVRPEPQTYWSTLIVLRERLTIAAQVGRALSHCYGHFHILSVEGGGEHRQQAQAPGGGYFACGDAAV